MFRTHTLGDLNKTDVGKKVTLSGWINKRRDLGSMIFIDLRDRYGKTQLVLDPEVSSIAYEKAKDFKNEWVISITGEVVLREKVNPNIKTGEIEVVVEDTQVLSKAKTTPFSIFDDKTQTNEELRLKYRYLDIRREPLLEKLKIRHLAMQETRNFFSENGFLEVTTPSLCKSTPEGARDYLVPSRLFAGNFYALPQSPQIFKQLLMVGSIDKYFQIVTCFRDEDPRADRQPEFTQIDVEMSFDGKEKLFSLVEEHLKRVFRKCKNIDIKIPFKRMSHFESLEKYGTDKPDLRFEMEFHRIDDIAKKSTFAIFLDVLKTNGCIKAINVKGGVDLSRKKLDNFTAFVNPFGLKGLAFIKKTDNTLSSNITKFFKEDVLKELENKLDIQNGDLIIIAAEKEGIVNQALDHLRRKIASDRNLIKENVFKFLWVDDFPLFEFDEENNRLKAMHHPFTAPCTKDLDVLEKEPLKVRADAYDLVLNGYEIAGGSQRIYDSSLQAQIFKLLNLSDVEIRQKFGFFIDALKYGTPPHGGIAYGFDRLIMMLTNTDNIRDVIAFPKTLKGLDLMSEAPCEVSEDQLNDLNIKTKDFHPITW
ncbi:MAG: Aspartate--tRNA(Asp/Asn) ligase [Candidatus Anoxychlamydiales bacterium]|nr:Aspartate--tRNA(Asp/Asn) ligase [Candidatus Anoxychlamydiales bacterium]NGX36241.1 Aspartate--tRNA(Asp/Asn) ligase [Candidatus Anoxychlamydiales bacterium]